LARVFNSHPMVVRLTRNQIQLLKEFTAAGKHGQSITAPISSDEFARLIRAQYIMRRTANPDEKLYVITKLGRRALAEAIG
jgi:hypothetical protein